MKKGKFSYSRERWRKYAEKQPEIIAIKKRRKKIGFLIPSINSYYGYKGRRSGFRTFVDKFLFPESKVFLRFLGLVAKKNIDSMIDPCIQIQLQIAMYYSKAPHVDVDNPKAVMDALKGILYEDDAQVFKLVTFKRLMYKSDKVVISWKPYLDKEGKERRVPNGRRKKRKR